MQFPYIPSLWILIPGTVVFLGLLGWIYGRGAKGVRARERSLLLAIRVAVVLLLLFCILNPVYRFHKSMKHKSLVAILIDDSASMSLADMGSGQKRIEKAVNLVFGPEDRLAGKLAENFRVRTYTFSRDLRELKSLKSVRAEGDRTHFASALSALLDRLAGESVSGVVVLSDDADNGRQGVAGALRVFEKNDIPIYTVGTAGEGAHARDIAVEQVVTHRRVTLETEVDVTVHVRSEGFEGRTVPLVLRRGREIERREIALRDRTQRFNMHFKAAEDGLVEYEVFIPRQAGELLAENNHRVFAVNASRHKLKVLYMEGTQYRIKDRPLWEFQYLVQALEEDKDIEVTAMLRDDVLAARRAGVPCVRDPGKGFPRTKKKLFDYDVIICSDVDIVYFTEEQLKHTVEFVGEHGGGYVMIGGYTAFGTGGYDESVIDKLLPVDMQGRDDGYTENVPFRWKLTRDGLSHSIMQLVPDRKKNEAVWAAMPNFYGYNHVQRAKPGATVLAEHPLGGKVMLAVQQYGKGRSMALVTDSTAGWGRDFETAWGEGGDNRHFRKFWRNAIRWVAAYQLKVPNRPVLLHTDANRYSVGDRARVWAEAWDKDYKRTHAAKIRVEIQEPGGRVTSERMEPDLSRPGVYVLELPLPAKGQYELRAWSALDGEGKAPDVARIVAGDPDYEFQRFRLDRPFLEKLAAQTRGRYFSVGEVKELPERLTKAVHLEKSTVQRSWWDRVWLLALILGLLGVEWFLRRRVGLP